MKYAFGNINKSNKMYNITINRKQIHQFRRLSLKFENKYAFNKGRVKLLKLFSRKFTKKCSNTAIMHQPKYNPIGLKEWNEIIENNFPYTNISINVNCLYCKKNSPPFKSKQDEFKRCRKCKLVYFCSKICKNKEDHRFICDELYSNINLDYFFIFVIVCKKKELVIFPSLPLFTAKNKK